MSLTRRSLASSSAAFGLFLGLDARAVGVDEIPASTREKTIHIANGAEPLSLDPHQASGTWENNIIGDMLIGLTTENAAGEPVPGMAREWTTTNDGLVWTFKMREANWSDGVPVTAADFEYAMRRILTRTPPAKYASILYVIKNAEKVETRELPPEQLGVRAIDAGTLEITLEHAAPYLPNLLTHYTSFPVPKHVVEKVGDDWIKPENIVVNGPFKLKDWLHNGYVHLIKNRSFYDAASVCLDNVYFYPIRDDRAAERLVRDGTLDIARNFSGSRLVDLNRDMPGYARVHPYIGLTYYVFNFQVPLFDDVKVRTALSMAIDRDFIIDHILRGGQTPAYTLVPPGITGYNVNTASPDWKGLDHKGRLAQARALLVEAGYGPEKPLEFSIEFRRSGDNPRVIPVVAQNFGQIADWVKATPIGADVQINYEKLRRGDFMLGDAGWVGDYNDAANYLNLLVTRFGSLNYGRYSNPQFDQMMALANEEADAGRRTALMQQAEKLLLDDAAIIPVFFLANRNLVSPRITGWVDNFNDIHRSRYLCISEAR